MADHGTAELMGFPPMTPLMADVTTYVVGIDQPQPYAIAATLMSPPPSPSLVAVVTSYGVGGTIDNSYHAPIVGQLWPRGDLDAE